MAFSRGKRSRRSGGRSSTRKREVDPENVEACREAALSLLDRTRQTRRDLERKLKDRGYAEATLTEVIERLSAVGLVDDIEYARAWLSGRWGRRPAGWRMLEQKLKAKGISPEDIIEGRRRLEEHQGPSDEVALARRAIQKTSSRYRGLEPHVRKQRLYAMLARKGFDSETIQAALSGSDGQGR